MWVIFKKKSILWVIFKKIQFFDSYGKKKSSILRLKKKFNSLSHFLEKSFLCVIFEKRVQFIASYARKKFNSLRHIQEKESKSLVIFKEKWFISVSRNKKSSILWVVFYKKVQFCVSNWKKFNSLSLKKGSIVWVISQKVQFFESKLKKKGSIRVIFDKRYSLSHIQKKSNSLTHCQKIKGLFFESILKERLVIFKNKINSSSYIF